MKQYKDNFTQYGVDGEVLADCDDEILQKELHISSRLHRLKLSKVITGQHCAASILEGQSPYVCFDRSQ